MRTRRHITKFYQMKTHLQGVSLKLQTLKSNEAMASAMKGATRVGFPCRSSHLSLAVRVPHTRAADVRCTPMPGDAVDERADEHAAASGHHAGAGRAQEARQTEEGQEEAQEVTRGETEDVQSTYQLVPTVGTIKCYRGIALDRALES